jgi:alpha-mannosidase
LVTAFGENSYGEGTTLRLWEQAGISGRCKVTLPKGSDFKKAFSCNLRGEITKARGIDIVDRSFECEVGANKPVSFVLK